MHPWNIAHRGGAQLSPENTLTAFGRAMSVGADGVELDVQLSRDGIVVIHHDFRLNPGYTRLRDGDWLEDPGPRIKDLTVEELHQYNIGLPRPGSSYAREHPLLLDANGEGIPTLETAVRISKIYSRFEMMVELKCDNSADSSDPIALADAAYDVVAAADFLPHTIFVGFDWRALVRIRARDPGAACWFTTDKLSGDARPVIDIVAAAGGQGWFPNFPDATPENVAYAGAKGLKVGAWTVNRRDDMQRLSDLDAICTDRPDLLQQITS
jgi:glycerophosphoryl diester phosphodiesterase